MKRKSKGKIILAVGLPGSGKSTYFAQRGIHPLSSDTLRLWLLDDEADQRHGAYVFGALRYLLTIRLKVGMPRNYIDATNLGRNERRAFFRLAEFYSYEMEAIFFDIPFEECCERNRSRPHPVPHEAMLRMERKLRPPTRDEGFTRIVTIRSGKSGKRRSLIV